MKFPLRALPVFIVCLSACGPTEEVPASASQREEIVGGTIAHGDPAVVALTVRYGGRYTSLCTGTLVAPKTVLTAAHCIYAYGRNAQYYVTVGTIAAQPTQAVQVVAQIPHPSYNRQAWDFGVLRLASPLSGVTPIPMNERPMNNSHVGQSIRHVGFGITAGNAQDSGTKREVTFPLRSVQQLTIESGAQGKQTCQGDSGGPGFMVMPGDNHESVVGVVSYGDENCLYGGWDGRVDVAVSWVRTTMAAWETPTCDYDGKCLAGCTPIDQDCACATDGVCDAECLDPSLDADCPADCARNNVCSQQPCGRPDEDCVNVGSRCLGPVQCVERLCINDAQNPETYCTRQCDAATPCPGGMTCDSGLCTREQRPVRQLGESCDRNSEFCSNGICTGPASGITRCVQSCVVQGDCPANSICEAGGDSRRYCRPAELRFTPITLKAASIALGDEAPSCAAVGGSAGLWCLGVLLLRRRARR